MQLIKECVKVINKPCVQGTRYMRLISWTLQSGRKQFIYNWKEKRRKPESRNWKQLRGLDQRTAGKDI
jgi:hypothetical protein